MAIVSYRHRFIFVKTRKTAGTSIQASLLPHLGPHDLCTQGAWDQVSGERSELTEFPSLAQLRDALGLDPADFTTWGVTRHPCAIALSRYFYQLRRGRIAGPPSPAHFNQWLQRVYVVGEPGFPAGRMPLDRSRLLLLTDDGAPLVDFIGRFERLEHDVGAICARLGLDGVTLSHVNQARPALARWQDWLDAESLRLIRRHFDVELRVFDYAM